MVLSLNFLIKNEIRMVLIEVEEGIKVDIWKKCSMLTCGKNGHTTSTCYKLKNLILGNSSSQSQNESSPSAFVASGSNGINKSWILDTRATFHLTNDASSMGNPTPFTRNNGVLVGNGVSLSISHSGHYFLNTNDSHLFFQKCCAHHISLKTWFLLINFVKIMMSLLNFTL